MKSLDILTTSPDYFYKKGVVTRKENLYFDIGYEGLSTSPLSDLVYTMGVAFGCLVPFDQ